MLLAGPAPADDDMVTVGYWNTQGIFGNLVCDTGTDGADLGVQNDLEVEGDVFTDSIKESTTAAGVTIDGVLIKDGEVDGVDVTALDSASHAESHTVASHSDTTATGLELDELTDGSETTLHSHAGGGGYTPVVFMARKTDGSTIAATTGTNPPLVAETLTWDENDITDTGFSYSAGEVTIGSAINGKRLEVSVQLNADGQIGRSQLVVEVQVDTGSGYVVAIRGSDYNARDSDQNEGATVISGFIIPSVATGDKIKIMAGNNADSSTKGAYGTNGCFWSMKTLS